MPGSIYFNTKDKFIQWKLNKALFEMIENIDKTYKSVSVICIGTDRSTGDSFGPLTGHMLSALSLVEFDLYGTLERPVHALTLPDVLDGVDTDDSLVIAVDAGVGNADMVGSIGMSYEPVKPGSGLGKTLPSVGDISLTGIVAMGGLAPFIMLQNAPLGLVYNMAEKTFFAIQYALRTIQLKERLDRKSTVIKNDNKFTNSDLPSSYTAQNG
ncbi:MAG TPA: spore protease YyaC [Ruminiclostridium sp.]|nr:spore protease YyaC [Ruminiclostridium sp.]